MMQILSSHAAPQVFVTTTCGATSDAVSIMTRFAVDTMAPSMNLAISNPMLTRKWPWCHIKNAPLGPSYINDITQRAHDATANNQPGGFQGGRDSLPEGRQPVGPLWGFVFSVR